MLGNDENALYHLGYMNIKGLYRMAESKFWWYRWTGADGKRRATSLRTEDDAEALREIKKIQAGEHIARWEAPDVVNVATKVVDNYLQAAQSRAKKPMRARTAKRIRYTLLDFVRDTEIQNAHEITAPRISGWLAKQKAEGKSRDTVHKYGMTLKPFVRYLVEKRQVNQPALNFEIPETGKHGRKNWLRLEDVDRVIAASTDPDLTFILYCGFKAGLRRSEILNAKVNWFDLGAGLLHAQNMPEEGYALKDSDNRTIPLSPSFKEFLTGYLAAKAPYGYALRPEKANGKDDYRYDFKRVVYTHFKRCGVTCTIHDMRRSFASNLVSRNQSIYKVAKWLGDGVAVVEKSYGHLAPADSGIDVLG